MSVTYRYSVQCFGVEDDIYGTQHSGGIQLKVLTVSENWWSFKIEAAVLCRRSERSGEQQHRLQRSEGLRTNRKKPKFHVGVKCKLQLSRG